MNNPNAHLVKYSTQTHCLNNKFIDWESFLQQHYSSDVSVSSRASRSELTAS